MDRNIPNSGRTRNSRRRSLICLMFPISCSVSKSDEITDKNTADKITSHRDKRSANSVRRQWCYCMRLCLQGGPKKRTPEKQYGCPLFWTTLFVLIRPSLSRRIYQNDQLTSRHAWTLTVIRVVTGAIRYTCCRVCAGTWADNW